MKQLIAEKDAEIKQLIADIKLADEEIESLKAEIEELDRGIQRLENDISAKESEINELGEILRDRNERLSELTGEQVEPEIKYRAAKGDEVDALLAQYINFANCPVPIKRLGNGFYLFGMKKIYAKILNGKLVIRVGGGYMIIEEFIQTYADQELHKLEKLAEREGVESFMMLDLEAYAAGKKKRPMSPTTGSPRMSMRSPKAGKSPSNLSTVHRKKGFSMRD